MKGTTAMTSAERARKHREARKAEGYRLIQVHLEPQPAIIVDHYERSGLSTSDAVNKLINMAYRKHGIVEELD